MAEQDGYKLVRGKGVVVATGTRAEMVARAHKVEGSCSVLSSDDACRMDYQHGSLVVFRHEVKSDPRDAEPRG